MEDCFKNRILLPIIMAKTNNQLHPQPMLSQKLQLIPKQIHRLHLPMPTLQSQLILLPRLQSRLLLFRSLNP